MHNHGGIPFEKEGVLKGPATIEVIQLTLYTVQMLDVPNAIKDRRRVGGDTVHGAQSASDMRGSGKRHLPSMLIKFEQFGILCRCLWGIFFLFPP